ncbi:MAG: PD-(D/E)XK nuclease family protein [Anaerolineae bacterium]
MNTMPNDKVKQIMMQELPDIMRRDPEVQEFILDLSREHFADKTETESRFDRVLEELRQEREENSRRWEENSRRWEENSRRWEENSRRWEENNRRWEENSRRWEENQAAINAMLKEIQGLHRKHDSTIGALGARWGLHTEQSFRNALKGILEDSFDVEVLNVIEFDEEGEVFGRPDQVELDVIIKNGTLILCEIKSSMSKSDMYAFERKVRFYEKQHRRKVDRALVISPMVEQRAKEVAQELGIEVYSYAEEVDPHLFTEA